MNKMIEIDNRKYLNKTLYVYILNLLEFFSLILDEDYNLCELWGKINYIDDDMFNKSFNKFFFRFKIIKECLNLKKQEMFYNKIYKILDDVKLYYIKYKIIPLNLDLLSLYDENKFLYLPYRVKINYSLK